MKTTDPITRYAYLLIQKYGERAGLAFYYEMNDLEVTGDPDQFFKKHARAYYQFLLGVIPKGSRAAVDKKVQELRKALKQDIAKLVEESRPEELSPLGVQSRIKPFDPAETELGIFGGQDRAIGEELWDKDELGPKRPD